MANISGRIELTPAWFKTAFDFEEPNPFQTPLDTLVEIKARKHDLLCEAFRGTPLDTPPEPLEYFPVQHDGRNVCACAYGGPYPTWDPQTASFWHDRHFIPWKNLDSAEQIAAIPIPDWDSVRMVREMRDRYNEMQSLRKYNQPIEPEFPWTLFSWTNPDGHRYRFAHFMSFIDLGCFMVGETEFFTLLAGDEVMANALMEKCFELSTSFSEYLQNMYGLGRPRALSSFGGDNSCMVSPEMYRRYIIKWDQKIIDRYGNLPANLHSCGPSAHLYDVWAEYPHREKIVLMQTRGIPGQLPKLRKSLPSTCLQITVHQPQFDFEAAEPEQITALLEGYAAESEYRDMEIVVVVNRNSNILVRNVRTFYQFFERL